MLAREWMIWRKPKCGERKKVQLDQDWMFREHQAGDLIGNKDEEWLSVAQFPSNIHLDLMKHGKIPDPFINKNEILAEWVGERNWDYKTTFPTPSDTENEVTYLTFDGLDTFCTVTLNGKKLFENDNMFISTSVNVTDVLYPADDEQENVLLLEFESALKIARAIKTDYPDHKWICWNGESARLAVRKAQYHWSWDWGPFLMACGPWRNIYLESVSAKITDTSIVVEVSEDCKCATLTVDPTVEVENYAKSALKDMEIKICINHEDFHEEKITTNDDPAVFKIDNPNLWWPHGYGKQTLYQVKISLILSDTVLDTQVKNIGIRKAELVQEKDKHGKSFYFRINGVDVYCGGSNWIPGDSFLPTMNEKRYREWLTLMVHGNQRMIRVWGGGIYEEDIFYDICDELGILVWQDFMFGCGNYPTFPWILESIEVEARQNVRRLRHHPSVVIFAGNNEDYSLAESSKLTYDYEDKNPDHWLKTDFPARYIYEKILPEVVEEEGDGIVYHPGSPWKEGKKTSDPTEGDIHQWNERYQQSSTIDFHNKAAGHERRIATYIEENFRVKEDFEAFIHLSQLVQSEAMAYGYRGWRRQWGDDRKCGGALVWQLDDCWPTISWAIVDYYLRRKPAYYTIARALQSLSIGVQREHWDWSVSHARPPKETKWEVWASSFKTSVVKGSVKVRFISIDDGKDIQEPLEKDEIDIVANGTTEAIFTGIIDNTEGSPYIIAAWLYVDDKLVAQDVDWPQPLKYLSFKDRGLEVKFDLPITHEGDVKGQITVTARKPVKGLVWEERTGVRVSDSAMDIVPGETYIVDVYGLVEVDEALKYRYLEME